MTQITADLAAFAKRYTLIEFGRVQKFLFDRITRCIVDVSDNKSGL